MIVDLSYFKKSERTKFIIRLSLQVILEYSLNNFRITISETTLISNLNNIYDKLNVFVGYDIKNFDNVLFSSINTKYLLTNR